MLTHRWWSGPDPAPTDTDRAHRDLGHELRDWTTGDLPPEIEHLTERLVPLVVPEHEHRHRANVARLWILLEHGGWWADHDLTPLVPFDSLPFPATAAHRAGNRCNCWLAFPKGHPALTATLAALAETPPAAPQRSPWVSGERVLDRFVGDDVARLTLPVDADGKPNRGAVQWCRHGFASKRVVT